MAKAKGLGLLEAAAAAKPPRKKIWLDGLPPEARQDLEELKRRWHAGNYPGLPTPTSVWKLARSTMPGIPKGAPTFFRWLMDLD